MRGRQRPSGDGWPPGRPDDPGQAWDVADRYAVVLLWRALPEVRSAWVPAAELRAAAGAIRRNIRKWPYRQLARAAWGSGRLPADDTRLWLDAAGAFARESDLRKLEPDAYSVVSVLRPADWAGAVIGLIRAGAGAVVTGEALADWALSCAETVGQPRDYAGDDPYDPFADAPQDRDETYDPFASAAPDGGLLEQAFQFVLAAWEAVGAIDEVQRLTPLGWWGLPRALARAWGGDFDEAGWTTADDLEAASGTWPGVAPHPADLGFYQPPFPWV